MKEFKTREFISACLLSASLAISSGNNSPFEGTKQQGPQPHNHDGVGLVIPEESVIVERQQISNPFVLKQAEIEIGEGSFFLTRPDGVIKELSESEILELSQNQMYLLLLAEQASLARDVSQTYTLNNPQFFHNLYFYKEGNSLFVAGVTTFVEENGNRGIVFKDITDFAMPFYIQDEDNFSVARLPDGRFIPYYTNNNDLGRYTLTVGESLEPTSASLMEIPEGTDIENLEPIVFPQLISPIEGRVNIRQGPTTESQILAVMDYTQQLPVLGVVTPNSEIELWYVVPLTGENGEIVPAFVFSEVTRPQSLTTNGNLVVNLVPKEQLKGNLVTKDEASAESFIYDGINLENYDRIPWQGEYAVNINDTVICNCNANALDGKVTIIGIDGISRVYTINSNGYLDGFTKFQSFDSVPEMLFGVATGEFLGIVSEFQIENVVLIDLETGDILPDGDLGTIEFLDVMIGVKMVSGEYKKVVFSIPKESIISGSGGYVTEYTSTEAFLSQIRPGDKIGPLFSFPKSDWQTAYTFEVNYYLQNFSRYNRLDRIYLALIPKMEYYRERYQALIDGSLEDESVYLGFCWSVSKRS